MFPFHGEDDIDAAGDPDLATGEFDFGDVHAQHMAALASLAAMGQTEAAPSNGGGLTYKIFVGGLPPNTSDETLCDSFAGFGAVAGVEVKRDSLTGRTRGFGFIEFQDEASVDAVVANFATNMVAGKWVECKRAVPRGPGLGPGPASMGRPRPSPRPPIRPVMPAFMPFQGHEAAVGNHLPQLLPRSGGGSAAGDSMKIFVGGLPHNCSAEQLTAYFGQYGNITGIEVKVDPSTGRTRGFGFVQFDSPEPVNAVLEHFANHVIEGKWVEVKRAVGKDSIGGGISAPPMAMSAGSSAESGFGGGDALESLLARVQSQQSQGKGAPPQVIPRFAGGAPERSSKGEDKIFVGGLPLNTPDELLAEYFSQFGAIVAAEVKKEKDTGRTRGFGFVQFEDPASVAMVMQNYEAHSINGKWVEVKRAVPPQKVGEGVWIPAAQAAQIPAFAPRPRIHALTRPGDTLAGFASASRSSSPGWGKGAARGYPSQPGPDAVEQPNKIFVGGLPMDCQPEMLHAYFGQYGGIVAAEVKTDPTTGRTRGFGFVEFEDPLSAALVLANNSGHMIEGKAVEVKPAVGHSGGRGGGGSQSSAGGATFDAMAVQALLSQLHAAPAPSPIPAAGPGDSDKIFVGGLPPNTPDEALTEYFSQYGTVAAAEVKKDMATGQTRGFGFVQFESSGAVDLIMANYENHSIGGKWIEVKRTLPRGAAPPPVRGGGKGVPILPVDQGMQFGGYAAYGKGGGPPVVRTDRAFRIKPY